MERTVHEALVVSCAERGEPNSTPRKGEKGESKMSKSRSLSSSTTRKPRAPQVTVVVTPEIIQEAVERHSGHCVIADAVRRTVPEASHVSVDLQTVRFTDKSKGLRYTYLTPRRAQVCLVKFDQGVLPEPFEIRLNGGHVTAAGNKNNPKLSKATVRNTDGNKVLERVGGKTPPVAGVSNRRAFGLRAFDI